ncbi:shikimate dehydrogenase [Polaromonas eurypsychrophila]|uniref:Shikimate dehydrogenase (NADP(+)) n=1 Tax=Polaromonas eurypsychrophila TaxID=1614635 RepID=A0A916SDL2_9BURK|nr:shikimate dehydrogenase [Polaromonas eurypsychrophila]GGA95312.1 shikimate dehydrogenase (NADP(+)) [Polaromonas eurypsychrophila]
MDHYCVLGNPVAHSKSPAIHARFAELTGQAMDYSKLLAPLDGFIHTLRHWMAHDGRGCNVTVPFKFEAFRLANTASDRATLAQAANTLKFGDGGQILADNTDGIGLVNDIQINAGISLAGRDILLLGAGGAAAGVLGPLLAAGPRRLVVTNRTHAKALDLVARHADHPSLRDLLQKTELLAQEQQGLEANFDVIVNATASSLGGSAAPVDARVLKPGALAYDMMYGTAAQGFADWARAHGAMPRDGLGMLVEQAAESFAFWRGVRPPSAQVLQDMRKALA